jgi:phospholipid N-methyltransferase
MRTRRLAPLIGISLALASIIWRTVHRLRQLPYLFWMAVNPFTDWLSGTRTLLGQLDFRPGQHVLEIGPGLGRILLPAASRILPGGDVTGLEIDHGIAEALRERAAAADITNLTVIEGDAATQELPAAHFDVA